MNQGRMLLRVLVIACLVVSALAYAGGTYELRHTIDGGGAMLSSGSDLELSGTIGQPDAGTMGGGEFTLTGGFWFPLAPGDCNVDGGVDLFDHDALTGCLTGPNGGVLPAGCTCFDQDHDGDTDMIDFKSFQAGFTGG